MEPYMQPWDACEVCGEKLSDPEEPCPFCGNDPQEDES